MSRNTPRPGRTLSNGPPEGQPWFWITRAMLASSTFRALGIHARRILDLLLTEHMSHAGTENGNLGATYNQLEEWGVTAADVRKGYAELYATGFVRQTVQGLMGEGGGTPSRYALTWYPTGIGRDMKAPTHDWLKVIDRLNHAGIGTPKKVRQWLKEEVSQHRRGKPKLTAQVSGSSPIKREAKASG
jgi:hypothetical protein